MALVSGTFWDSKELFQMASPDSLRPMMAVSSFLEAHVPVEAVSMVRKIHDNFKN
jgi:hypothetical protein